MIGYFLQQQELIQNTQATRGQEAEIARTAEQATIQSEKLAAAESYMPQEVTLRLVEAVSSRLGGIAGMLYISSHCTGGDFPLSEDKSNRLFSEHIKGAPEVFSRKPLAATLQVDEHDIGSICSTKLRYEPDAPIDLYSLSSL